MSGPKYSYTKIDQERARLLIKKLEEEIEKARCDELKKEISAQMERIEKSVQNANLPKYTAYIQKAESLIPESDSLAELKKYIKLYDTISAEEYNLGSNSDSLTDALEKYNNKNIRLNNIHKTIESTLLRLKSEYDRALLNRKESDFLSKEWKNPREEYRLCSPKVQQAYNRALESIIETENFDELKMTLDTVIENHNIDDDYKIKQIEMRAQASEISSVMSENILRMLKLKTEYLVLSKKLNRDTNVMPKTFDELTEEISKMKNELEQLTLNDYINRSLETVMEELGYDLAGSDVMTKQKMSKKYYDFSKNSVINVSTSQNGALMFEVLGRDNKGATRNKSVVKRDMELFCPDYELIKQKLIKHNITLEKEVLFEPDEKYARFISIDTDSQKSRRRVKHEKRLQHNE